MESEKRIQLRYLAHVGIGSDESWFLATLWFDGRPLAVLTYHGEDRDYTANVSNPVVLREMLDWIYSLAPKGHISGVVDADTPNESYTEFWGHTLHEFYDVTSGLPKRPPKKSNHESWGHYRLHSEGRFAGDDVPPTCVVKVDAEKLPIADLVG